MIRNALIIGGASFVLMLGSAAGVAALAGPVILKDGWTIPFDSQDRGQIHSRHLGSVGKQASPLVSRQLAWTGDTLTLDLPIDVTYVQGPVARIEVSGPAAVVDRLRVDAGRISLADGDGNLNADSLTIDRNGIRVHSYADQTRIVVTAPNISQIKLDGSGDLEIQAFDQPTLSLAINGSGDVSAEGKVAVLSLTSAGSGEAQLDDLAAKNADLMISGSGNAVVTAKNVVTIALSGSGDVSLQAQPASLTANTSGSGTVQHDYE
ncbi:GIN domain-containing protein [Caulobacter henricii]|uniref:Putative auto-transporter adhesin head GIN domain-containing protein n=1 Tax=Caulobacter henricii TaxID=69395 RepID=A0A0P0NWX5_9CAUL|nr:DUF2807 domain-containing protein [Caulobacter henricii]ALL12092.1 hypothetical protein AQ619_01245 [Caulobacter henricii]